MSQSLQPVSVVVPCYNEVNAVAPVLEELKQIMAGSDLVYEIIAVDDGSTDGTAEKLDEVGVRVIRHAQNRGYGGALKTGARAAQYDWVIITDADGTYPNEQIPALVRLAQEEDYDMVVGARTGAKVRIPLIRRPAKWAITQLARYLSGHHIPDLNSGLRVTRKSVWDRFERYYPDGFSLTSTITLSTLTSGCRVKFVPIDYHHRVGSSKIRPIADTLNFIKLIVRTVLYFDPLKVFVPLSLLLLLASLVVGGASFVLSNVWGIGRFLDTSTLLLFVTAMQLLAIGALADLITKRLP